MKLLTQTETKTIIDSAHAERDDRIQKMMSEESEIAKRLNKARSDAKEEMETLELDLKLARIRTKDEISNIEAQIESKRQERADLMKPIDEKNKEADQRIESAIKKESEIESREKAITETERLHTEKTEVLQGWEARIGILNKELGVRESKIVSKEESLKEYEKSLIDKQNRFNEIVDTKEKYIKNREMMITEREKTHEALITALSDREKEIVRDRRALIDAYATLERSKMEIQTGKRKI